jgi:hypothetical protein
MKMRRYFFLVMATLYTIFAAGFGVIGLAHGDLQINEGATNAWLPCLCCLSLAGFFFFIGLIISKTPSVIHSDDEQS